VSAGFFEYGNLRRIWQYKQLTPLKPHLPNTPKTSQLIDNLFKRYENGFYVYATQPMAESPITNFVKTNTVTFWYTRNGKRVETTMPALEFIDKLVKLIPDKDFKLIRCYGAYSRRRRRKLHNATTALTRDIPTLPKKGA
jgi:hypothetical protein